MESVSSNESWHLLLVKELEVMNTTLNEGRGVSVARSIIAWLKMGNVENAKREAVTDHDKIRNYPELQMLLEERLFQGTPIDDWQ